MSYLACFLLVTNGWVSVASYLKLSTLSANWLKLYAVDAWRIVICITIAKWHR
jgi:hypothetical protein